ncbi:MAG: hypothetical protein J3K34DRAFT_485531 [Monoraphidium minutum]|nr:MAG: hypothetical protein J3K34DRAFT_485531 [Monoraphidium minutum]
MAARSGPAACARPFAAAPRPQRLGAALLAPRTLPAAAAADGPRAASGAAASTSGAVPASTPGSSYIRRSDVSLFDALKFNGPAPEIINGRLAMIGMLLVARGEAQTGQTALALLQSAAPWQYALVGLWVYASMVPVLKGARHEAFGMFTPRAEFTNGRAAMIGWAVLLWLESKAGVPFF